MKRFNWTIISIILITIISLVVNFSQPFEINFDSKIPLINQPISVHQKYPGINLKAIGIQKEFPFRKGLDLEGGTSITLKADMAGVPASVTSAIYSCSLQRTSAFSSALSLLCA